MQSYRQQAAHLQQQRNNFTVSCCCVENYLRCAQHGLRFVVAHGMMEKSQLLTDSLLKQREFVWFGLGRQ